MVSAILEQLTALGDNPTLEQVLDVLELSPVDFEEVENTDRGLPAEWREAMDQLRLGVWLKRVTSDPTSTDLAGAYLSGGNLIGVNLSGANLSGADLSEAHLSGADLSGADLSKSDLSGADLSGANLSGANLSGADLCWAKVCRANLSGVNLSRTRLHKADLTDADLSCVRLDVESAFDRATILLGAILERAKLNGVTIDGKGLLNAARVDGVELKGAKIYCASLDEESRVKTRLETIAPSYTQAGFTVVSKDDDGETGPSFGGMTA